jgi:glycosyl hydrolase family 59/glycosyl hydrolase family 59 (putative galactocerebrosidase)
MKNSLGVVMAIVLACAAGVAATHDVVRPMAHQSAIRVTHVTVDGDGGARVYDGVGAIIGGGGNARYLMDYPAAQRAQILDYLFKPGYGAALQILKLEIGGDGNSSDGAEPSVEHTAGHINCDAGYEFAIAQQAVALNPRLRLYGLQWGAPGWVGQHSSLFTSADIRYVLDWLGCAKQHGLQINYLGGWNERDHHGHADWYRRLHVALDKNGYRAVRIVAGDTVKGGHGLAGKTVHVWSSNFDPKTGRPSSWFVRQRDITPVHGRFSITVRPGRVYSLTTTTGQGKGHATGPPARALPLPYTNSLAAGAGEPTMLAAQDGSFELAPCQNPDGSGVCTQQTTVHRPVLWVPGTRHPYAIIGSSRRDYALSVRVMLPQSGSAGLIGRYHAVSASHGTYNAYVFDVNTNGSFTLKARHGGKAADIVSGQRQLTPPHQATLARGRVPFAPGTWHTLSVSLSGTRIRGSVDGRRVAALTSSAFRSGIPGIEVGGWYPAYFADLSVTRP